MDGQEESSLDPKQEIEKWRRIIRMMTETIIDTQFNRALYTPEKMDRLNAEILDMCILSDVLPRPDDYIPLDRGPDTDTKRDADSGSKDGGE